MRRGVRWSHLQQAFIWSADSGAIDKVRSQEEVTMQAIRDMASDVMPCLNFTCYSLSQNADGTMPVLDTCMWVGVSTRKWDFPA